VNLACPICAVTFLRGNTRRRYCGALCKSLRREQVRANRTGRGHHVSMSGEAYAALRKAATDRGVTMASIVAAWVDEVMPRAAQVAAKGNNQ
jgi:hypothetical protein